jgi:NitT/TauT family transport system substrate-binding protein
MTSFDEAASLGTLRGAFEATGSPSWIMRTIRRRGLDRSHGFTLELNLGGDTVKHSLQATEAVLAEGAADVVDTDWLSIARWRRDGFPVKAVFPYGRIMGGMVVSAASAIHHLPDIRGRRIGVVRNFDKNWLVVRAACLQRHGFDPQHEAQVSEAMSKTVLLDWLESGAIDVAVLYWHLIPQLTGGGRFRQLQDVLDLVPAIAGVNPPTTFFVCREDLIAVKPGLVRAFVAAYCDAVRLMREDPRAWAEAVADVESSNPDVTHGLRASWERRVCTSWGPEDLRALTGLFDRLKAIGGEDAVGGLEAIPPEIFSPAFTN